MSILKETNTQNPAIDFPKSVSLTITNHCNLRCKICGQWNDKGYIKGNKDRLKQELNLQDWKKLIDEIDRHKLGSVLLRGGEAFLFPGIMELIEYINAKGIYISIDTNGTLIDQYAKELVHMGNIHLTFSVDGPEDIHDKVRNVKGCFKKMKENILLLHEIEKTSEKKLSKSITFTISPDSYMGLGKMPDVARSLSINSIVIVPYYYVTEKSGKAYDEVMQEHFSCKPYSWHGFHRESSGIDLDEFSKQYNEYKSTLGEITEFPYMGSTKTGFSKNDLREWFENPCSPVGTTYCMNVESFIDIQSNGDANFCTDFPDYIIGNVTKSSIYEIWNSEKASNFRTYRREKQFPVCYRCGAKYMSEIPDKL